MGIFCSLNSLLLIILNLFETFPPQSQNVSHTTALPVPLWLNSCQKCPNFAAVIGTHWCLAVRCFAEAWEGTVR